MIRTAEEMQLIETIESISEESDCITAFFLPDKAPIAAELLKCFLISRALKANLKNIDEKWYRKVKVTRLSKRKIQNMLWRIDLWGGLLRWTEVYFVSLYAYSSLSKTGRINQDKLHQIILFLIEKHPSLISLIPHGLHKINPETQASSPDGNAVDNILERYKSSKNYLISRGAAELVIWADPTLNKRYKRISVEGGDPSYLAKDHKGWLCNKDGAFPIPLDYRVLQSYERTQHVDLTYGHKTKSKINPKGFLASQKRVNPRTKKTEPKHIGFLLPDSKDLISFLKDGPTFND